MSYYRDKVVWITGASSGIGFALAMHLAKFKAKLVLSGRNEEALAHLQRACDETEVLLLPFDVTDKAANQKAVDAIIERFGRVDIAFLNAGIGGKAAKADPEKPLESAIYEKIFQVNVFSVLYALEALMPKMNAQYSAHIVVTASVSAFYPLKNSIPYSASKAALRHIMRALSAKLQKSSVKLSTVYPGFIDTPMTAHIKRKPLMISADKAAGIIIKRVALGEEEIVFPKVIAWFLRLQNSLSIALYKKLSR